MELCIKEGIKFRVNGVEHIVGSDVCSDTMLLDYLREYLQLRGTKYMCREGGCGACIVTAAKTPGSKHQAINSCLTSVTSCHGWDIKTIEGLGNRKDGYHTLQSTLSKDNASQCGYCTPGWVMAMHGLMESNKNLTMLDIEKSVSSNLCRCTGYRPILDSFKKFATDALKEDKITDIKEMSICKTAGNCCRSSKTNEDGWCMVRKDDLNEEEMIQVSLKDGKTWYRPKTLTEVLGLLEQNLESYMLVAGNTAKGAYPVDDYPKALIDIHHLQELRSNDLNENYIVGAGLTISELLDVLKAGAEQPNFSYFSKLYEHVELVAHIPIRNVATIAGNLMIKHAHNVFQSDLYLLLDTVGAQLTIVDYHGVKEVVTMANFLTISMKGKVILNVLLPPLNGYQLFTYKLMPRAQSAHAIVNFGFLCKLDLLNKVKETRITYGALSQYFHRAVATEKYLVGKFLFTNETLQGALKVLDGEIIVEAHPPEPSVEYRRYIAKALFFKALLTLSPKRGLRYDSATIDLHKTRPVSKGKQIYTTNPIIWPMNKPIPKLEAAIQCAGEAQYTDDIPSFHNEVFGAFVLSTVGKGTILEMDPSEALATPGVVAFYTYKDIPGLNSFTPSDFGFTSINEEVLSEGTIRYHGQPIAIIVAETRSLADRASRLVKVKYSNVTRPVVDIKEAKQDSTRNTVFSTIDATGPGKDKVSKTITGSNVLYGQYHCSMETMVSVAKPTEEGLEVHLSSQWLDGAHTMISRAVNIPQNKIDVYILRVGGSYGLKITRCIQGAVACSVVANKLNRPCRFIQPITTNMKAFGKRMPNVTDYKVAVNRLGEIQTIDTTIYTDNGCRNNEPVAIYGLDVYYNCYDAARFNYKSYNTTTDTPKNTFFRGPGTLEAIASIETIMERISYELSLDPLTVRLANLDKLKYIRMIEYLETLKISSEYLIRRAKVNSFNTQNRWKKQGLRFAFCRWPPVLPVYYDLNLSIYRADGTLVITHGGVEMGQGLNTKIAQVASSLLKIPIDKIVIKGNNTIISPNTYASGGSVTTESVIIALRRAIKELLGRLLDTKSTMTDPSWLDLVLAAFSNNVDLQVHGFVGPEDAQSYDMYSIALCQVEVDCLTGVSELLRVDIIQDVGVSINQDIDVGQIEGAFIQGVGYWTSENLVNDPANGELLTDRTWTYYLPQARDIPREFNVICKDSYSHERILGSKGIGEPPICLGVVVPFAIREAIVQARQENGIPTTEWFDIEGPYTLEKVCMAMKTKTEDFKLY